jgi:hypothetical protein
VRFERVAFEREPERVANRSRNVGDGPGRARRTQHDRVVGRRGQHEPRTGEERDPEHGSLAGIAGHGRRTIALGR